MVDIHTGEGKKQQVNIVTRNIHVGMQDMGTIFWWHREMKWLQKLQCARLWRSVRKNYHLLVVTRYWQWPYFGIGTINWI